MLGLVNTVSSSSTPESKYSLNFDGSDDYLDTGATFNSVFQGNFSISVWINFADKDPSGNEYVFGSEIGTEDAIWFSQTSSQTYVFHFKSNNDAADSNAWATGYNDGDDGETGWQHFVFVVKNRGSSKPSQILCYQNAVLKTAVTSGLTGTNHAAFTSTNLFLGARNNDGTAELFSDSKISDFAIWNALLDGDAVTAIYNSGRPTNLTFDDGGNYDNSSALQAYYRMGNGAFDDKANGVIHDQHASGYGGELVNDGGFPTGTTAWSLDEGWSLGDGVANGNISGSLVFLYQAVGITLNKTYKANIEVKTLTSGSVNFYYFNGSSFINVASDLTLGPHTFYFTATGGTNGSIYIGTGSFAGSVTDISVKQLNGFPGITSGGPTFSGDTP